MKRKTWFTLMVSGVVSLFISVSAFAGWVFWEPLTYHNASTWQKADGYSNGSMFNCTWRANNANFTNDGKLRLSLTSPSNNKFDCGEYRSTNTYGYGLYEVSMKPAKNTGIVSSFSPIPVLLMAHNGMRLISSSWAKTQRKSNSIIIRMALEIMKKS